VDYQEDVRIGDQIIQGQVDAYRKIRNTMRYLLGNLAGFSEDERLPHAEMPELERFILHKLAELDTLIRAKSSVYEFTPAFQALYQFCIVDLSAFYFDIRKDCLYCDDPASTRRRAARTVLDEVFNRLVTWFAPILSFTAEEVWLSRFGADAISVHRQLWADTPAGWRDDALAEKWAKVRRVRRVVNGALEVDRREKRIGSSLQAKATAYVSDAGYIEAMKGLDLAESSITSAAEIVLADAPAGAFTLEDVADIAVVTGLASGEKCGRCWSVKPEVAEEGDLCHRCDEAVVAHDARNASA